MNNNQDSDALIIFSENEDQDFISEFLSVYTPYKILGSGAFSSVVQAHDSYGNDVAIKVIDKKVSGKSAKREVEILSSLDHPNILKFYQSRESSRKVYLITELLEGQTLESFLTTSVTNDQIVFIIKQLLLAIQYVHSMDIIHRDIKPENIIINSTTLEIKLIDFGLSFLSQSQTFQSTRENCGTLIFMAPEMALKKEYFKSVDIWSCGIIQYMLFSRGIHPIWVQGVDNRQTYIEKLQQQQDWQFPTMKNLAAQNFFQKTASSHPESRMSASQSLLHPWITGQGELNSPITMADMVKLFSEQQKLIKLVKAQVFLKYLVSKCQSYQNTYIKKVPVSSFCFAKSPTEQDTTNLNKKSQIQFVTTLQFDEDNSSAFSFNLHDIIPQQTNKPQFPTQETHSPGNFAQFMKQQKQQQYVRKFDTKKKSPLYSPDKQLKIPTNTQLESSVYYNQSPQQQIIKQMRSSSSVFMSLPDEKFEKLEKIGSAKANFDSTSPKNNKYCSPQNYKKNISQHLPSRGSVSDHSKLELQLLKCDSTTLYESQKLHLPPLVLNQSSTNLPALFLNGSPTNKARLVTKSNTIQIINPPTKREIRAKQKQPTFQQVSKN